MGCVGGVPWGGVGCGLLPSLSLRGCGEEDAGELRPQSLGMGAGALAAGYPWLGWPGCPGVPWGQRLPTSAGRETTTCVSVTEVLRVLPQELTRRGDCGPGRPRGMTMKRKWGARMSPGGRHSPSAWGRPLPGAIPFLPWLWCCGGWWCGYLPTVVCARCRGYRPPLGAGTKRPVASPPLHNSPPGAGWPSAPAVVGGGARGSAGPLRSPGGPHCPYASRGGAGSYRTRGPRRPSRGGGHGGGQGVAAGGWRVAGARTAHWRASQPSSREAQLLGFRGPHPGAFAPPCAVSVWGRQRPLAAMTHGA